MQEFVGDHVNDPNQKRRASVQLIAWEVVVLKQMRIGGYIGPLCVIYFDFIKKKKGGHCVLGW